MDSQKQLFHKTFSIPQKIMELQIRDSIEIEKSKSFIKRCINSRNFATLLVTWFDFAYIFTISPFRFTKCKGYKTGFQIIRHKIQNLMCAICHISIMMMYIADVRSVAIASGGTNPVVYLEFFMVYATIIRHFLLVLILWKKSELFHKIVNILDGRRSLISKYSSDIGKKWNEYVPKTWMSILIASIYFFMSIFTSIILPVVGMSQNNFQLQNLEHFEIMIKYNYFIPTRSSKPRNGGPVVLQGGNGINEIGNVNNNNNSAFIDEAISDIILSEIENYDGITPRVSFAHKRILISGHRESYEPNIPLLILGMYTTIMRFVFGCSSDCLILVVVLSLWFPVADFSKFIRAQKKRNSPITSTSGMATPSDVLQEYRSLKEISNLINASIKNLLIFVVLQAIFFYPVGVKELVASCEDTGIHYIGFFLLSFCITFYFAADICKQMQSFQEYLRNQCELTKLDRYMILQETFTNPVGIADEGRFVIDYSFVATVTSTLMTYFVVSIQHDKCN